MKNEMTRTLCGAMNWGGSSKGLLQNIFKTLREVSSQDFQNQVRHSLRLPVTYLLKFLNLVQLRFKSKIPGMGPFSSKG